MDIRVLLLVYLIVLVVNGVFSAISFFSYKEKLYKLSIYLWSAMFINFLLQAIFISQPIAMVLGFSTYFICSLNLIDILAEVSNEVFPTKKYWILMGVAYAATAILHISHAPFWLLALPSAVGVAAPMLGAALKTLRSPSHSKGARIYAALLVVNAIHNLDYPFLRPIPTFAIFGFSFALAILVAFSFFLPTFIIKKVADRYSSQLEGDVQKRTESLRQTNEKLLDLTSENKYLLSVVCHDIATPLQILNFHTMSLLEGWSTIQTDRAELSLKKMAKASQFITEILEDVKKLHALREGKVKLKVVQIDLDALISEVRFLNEAKLSEKKIEMVFVNNLKNGSGIMGDPSTLKNNVLNNLISNSIKFSHPHSKITISADYFESGVCLKISDSGVGIAKEFVDKIFQSQSLVSQLGTLGETGTGFGLPIVKTSLQHFGADIKVESRAQAESPTDHGTTFYIYFKELSQLPQTA